MIALNFPKRW